MSKNTKIIIAVIVIVLVVGGVWWYMSMKSGTGAISPSGSQSNAGQNSGDTNTAPVLSQSTSDASLNQDLSAIDGQLNGLASDSANADQSLSSSTGQ